MADEQRGSSARSGYVPLTREEIEKVRSVYKRHFSDGERLDTVCDMAINALLYVEEIQRLRDGTGARSETADRQNARRYQWLKDAHIDVMDEILAQKAEEWDSLIDTQIAFEGTTDVRR